ESSPTSGSPAIPPFFESVCAELHAPPAAGFSATCTTVSKLSSPLRQAATASPDALTASVRCRVTLAPGISLGAAQLPVEAERSDASSLPDACQITRASPAPSNATSGVSGWVPATERTSGAFQTPVDAGRNDAAIERSGHPELADQTTIASPAASTATCGDAEY